MSSRIKLRITSIPNFISFLEKLKIVEKSVILELTKDKLSSKIHTPDKTVVKYVSEETKNLFEGDIEWDKIKSDRIKIGILEISRLIKAFKYFKPEEDVYFEIELGLIDNEIISKEIKLSSLSLDIKIKCADLMLLSYLTDDILSVIHTKENSVSEFTIYQSDFMTLLSLCGMENNVEEIISFKVTKDSVSVTGDSFKYKLNIGPSEILLDNKDMIIDMYKSKLVLMESETCKVYAHTNRIIMYSEESLTSIAIGLVEK